MQRLSLRFLFFKHCTLRCRLKRGSLMLDCLAYSQEEYKLLCKELCGCVWCCGGYVARARVSRKMLDVISTNMANRSGVVSCTPREAEGGGKKENAFSRCARARVCAHVHACVTVNGWFSVRQDEHGLHPPCLHQCLRCCCCCCCCCTTQHLTFGTMS